MKIRTFQLPTVFHVGNFEKQNKNYSSYEGNLLSVSLTPDSWKKIARIGGEKFILSNPKSEYIDAYAFWDDNELEILQWGNSKDLIQQVAVYTQSYYDDELDRECIITDEDPSQFDCDESELEESYTFKLTDKAIEKYNLKSIDKFQLDHLLIDYCEQNIVPNNDDIVGLWWQEELDVYGLSAPRGGIFESKIDNMKVINTTVSFDEDNFYENVISQMSSYILKNKKSFKEKYPTLDSFLGDDYIIDNYPPNFDDYLRDLSSTLSEIEDETGGEYPINYLVEINNSGESRLINIFDTPEGSAAFDMDSNEIIGICTGPSIVVNNVCRYQGLGSALLEYETLKRDASITQYCDKQLYTKAGYNVMRSVYSSILSRNKKMEDALTSSI